MARAYEQLQEIYADQGASGVAGFTRSCADQLSSDPGALDFCVAFDIYASALIGDGEEARAWRSGAGARDLALARAALPPTQDPAARIARIRELARETSLQDPDLGARPAHPATPRLHASAARPARLEASAARPASAHGARAEAEAEAAKACRRRATAGQRTVCDSPALRQADQALRRAYRRALAAGTNPRRLARDQARFRSAVNAAAPDRVAVERL